MIPRLNNDWDSLLSQEFEKDYFRRLEQFLGEEYETQNIFPAKKDVFNALKYTPYHNVKVVILGQDPYHGEGQAHGLSFSVLPGVATPPSLRNIFKELNADTGAEIPAHGFLKSWSEQGVLLLNTVLTVRKGQAHSHQKKGWETFTDQIISILNEREKPVIFLLWGKPAQKKMDLIDCEKHVVLTSPHPSPLSARKGFFGSRPFSKINHLLMEQGEEPIQWGIPKTDEK
ncbi:uracil-DNA glycosylase [Falsibacillus pallidus]|uniref:Uracil-DNA glycosylase n=1 Tax=Falsibacillus pallidus TaxID=493781 RepID=A0A370GDV1_9BACI|nr:uracil-DNA glycosylase [Falsibacillus pallidus]RDI41965.1 uracil-DNA glycosylase [Falsibacillus pallidus]